MADDSHNLSPIDWDFTIDTIREGKCILFLGSELFTNIDGIKLDEALKQYMKVGENEDILNYYEEEGLFLFKNKGAQTKSYYKIKNFFLQDFPQTKSLFEKIAQIPFHFIISMTPDKFLPEIFNELNFKSNNDFYWKNHSSTSKVKLPNSDTPLIYNLFGSIDRQESLVLTHNDLFEYLNSIFGERSIPKELKHYIQKAHNLIFLGIPFDKWYLQLLLRVLSLHSDSEFMKYAAHQAMDEELIALCRQQFSIKFIPERSHEFIDEIHRRCESMGILKKNELGKQSVSEHLMELIASDELKKAFDRLIVYLEDIGEMGMDLLDDTILLMNRHKRSKKRIEQGIISFSDSEVESNKIRKSLISLVNEVKTFE